MQTIHLSKQGSRIELTTNYAMCHAIERKGNKVVGEKRFKRSKLGHFYEHQYHLGYGVEWGSMRLKIA